MKCMKTQFNIKYQTTQHKNYNNNKCAGMTLSATYKLSVK